MTPADKLSGNTPSQRLKDIEARLFSSPGEEAFDPAYMYKNPNADVKWLISRVKKLTEALERIQGMCDVGPACSCGRPSGLPAVISCAREALKEKKC